MSCDFCKYWHYVESQQIVINEPKQGECWRYPPTMQLVNNNQLMGIVPRTNSLYVCGEYISDNVIPLSTTVEKGGG